MLRAFWSLTCMDLLHWRRTPLAIVSALLPPIAMVVLLEALSIAVTQQPVALVVEGRGAQAEKMAQIIKDDDDAYLLTVTDRQNAQRMLSSQQVAAVITVPADFDGKLEHYKWWQPQTHMATVELQLNNVDIDFADDIRRSVDRSILRFGSPYAKSTGDDDDDLKGGQAPAPPTGLEPINPYLVNIEEHDLRQTNVEWMNYQIIPALVLLVLNVSLTGTALLCAYDVERKTARMLLLAPTPRAALIAARLFGGFIAGMAALLPALIICVAAHLISPPPAHWPALLSIFAATALCASGLGAIVGTLLTGTRMIAMAACVLATYLFLLGGGFTTIAFLPQWLRALSAFVPTRYAIDAMRQALFYQQLDGVGTDLIVLCSTAVVACLAGCFTVKRSWAS